MESTSSRSAGNIYAERATEKQDMQKLNERLEYYVDYQREKQRDYHRMKDALGRAEADFDSKMKSKDLDHQRAFEDWQAERRVLDRDLAQRAEDARRFARENDDLKARNGTLNSENSKLDARCANLQGEKALLDKVLADTRNKLSDKERKLESKSALAAQLEDQLAKLKYENSDLASENAKNRSRLKDLEEQLQRFLKTKNEEVNSLKAELEERKLAQKRLEKELRDEFQKKLEDFIQKRREQFEREKAEWMKIFKEEYNRKIEAYKTANRDYADQIKQLMEDKARLDDKIMDLNTKISDLERANRKLESEVSSWRRDYDNQQKIIRDLKAALARKNQEFDELLGIKITLENEIQTYRKILRVEEDRCGFTKKRKISTMSYSSSSAVRKQLD